MSVCTQLDTLARSTNLGNCCFYSPPRARTRNVSAEWMTLCRPQCGQNQIMHSTDDTVQPSLYYQRNIDRPMGEQHLLCVYTGWSEKWVPYRIFNKSQFRPPILLDFKSNLSTKRQLDIVSWYSIFRVKKLNSLNLISFCAWSCDVSNISVMMKCFNRKPENRDKIGTEDFTCILFVELMI